MTSKETQQLCSLINSQTEINDHTGAVITLARHVKHTRALMLIQSVEQTQTVLNNVTDEMDKHRTMARNWALSEAKGLYGAETAAQIKSCF